MLRLGAACFAGLLSAAGGEPWSALKGDAQIVANLGRFLERFLGDCASDDPAFDKKGCEAQAEAERERAKGKRIHFEIEEPRERLELSGWDDRRKAFRVLLTPFFSERELALTVGQPKLRRSDGQLVVDNLPIWVTLPAGEAEFVFRRQLERGMVRLELLVVPGKPWTIERPDGRGAFRGVSADLVGLRLVDAKSGRVLAEQTYR